MEEKFKIKELKRENGDVYFELGYDPDNHWGLSNWIGSQDVEDVINGATTMAELMEEKKIKRWLNDNRQVTDSWDDANDWVANTWMPRVIKAGLERYSVILPEDLFSKLSAEFMADNAEVTGLRMINWGSEEDARAWLLED